MPENKLTDKNIRALKPTGIEQVFGDGGGLWVRVLPTAKGGAINFYYRYTANGKERRYNCGTYPKTTLAQARELRNSARSLVKQGVDPVLKDETDRAQRKADQAMSSLEKTVRDLFDDWKRVYLAVHRKDKGEEVEQFIKYDVFPVIGDMKAKTVRLPHIVGVVDKIVERGARRKANLVLSLMRQMFRHGLARGIVETDPTLGLSKKQAGGKETPADRNLSWEEIEELKDKLKQAGLHQRYQAAILFLLATGARVGELTHAKWDDIDQNENTWTIPATNSKNGRAHLVQISEFALAQLATLRETKSGPYLLPGREPDSHISEKTLSKAIRDRIRTESLHNRTSKTGALLLTGGEWSPHDLRRTMASRMGDLGIAPHVIERCLNHVQQGIIGVYQRQEYLAERKAAYDTWGAKLEIAGLTS
jgi:integrase